jgi:hypothetical protein
MALLAVSLWDDYACMALMCGDLGCCMSFSILLQVLDMLSFSWWQRVLGGGVWKLCDVFLLRVVARLAANLAGRCSGCNAQVQVCTNLQSVSLD